MPDGPAAALLAVVVVLGFAPAATVGANATGSSAATVANDAAIPPSGAATAPGNASTPTRLTDCTTVTEPGEYVLAGDVRNGSPTDPRTGLGACIAIRADDVTLRGGGHTVAAAAGGRPGVVGVLVGGPEHSNVTVRNLTTTRWGAGVAVLGVADATFRNVSAVNNLGDGFFVENAPGARLLGGTVRASNTGVFLRNAPDARVADLTVVENLAGVAVRRSDGAAVRRVEVSGNRQFGVGIFASANVTVADATASADGFAGVALSQVDDASLRNLTVTTGSASGPGGADPTGVYLNDSRARLVGVTVADAPGLAVYATGGSTAVGERVRLGGTGTAGSLLLSFESRDVALDPANEVPPLPMTERQVVGDPLFAFPTGGSATLSLSVSYDDAAVERASTTEETLALWRFDAGEGWLRTETTVDAEANAASATLGNVSENGTVVALVGEGLAEAGNATA